VAVNSASVVQKKGDENRTCVSNVRFSSIMRPCVFLYAHGRKENPNEGSETSILGRLVQRCTRLLSDLRRVREISSRGY